MTDNPPLPVDDGTGEETIAARDYDPLGDEDDGRTWIELAPAGHVDGCDGDPDDYVLWIQTDQRTLRYRLSYDQGGHVMQAMMRAFRQATNGQSVR